MFYAHSREMIEIMERNPAIRNQTYTILERAFPYMLSLLQGKRATIPQQMIDEAESFCGAVGTVASPSFRRDLATVRTELKNGELLKKFGVKTGTTKVNP